MPTFNVPALREQQHISDLRLTVIPMPILLAAQVTGGPSRGQRTISYDTGAGDVTDIVPWLRVHIGTVPGAKDIAVLRVKSFSGTATSGTLEFDENGLVWANGQHITVYHFYSSFIIQNRPYYNAPSPDFNQFKFYDIDYPSSGNANSIPDPVCIAGTHQVQDLVAGSATFNFDLTGSYPIAQGATITSYGLTVAPAANATVNFNTGTGIGTIDVTVADTWWVTATCTDSNGKSEERFLTITAEDAANPGYINFQLNSFGARYGSGVSFSLTIFDVVSLQDFPDSTLVILWNEGDKFADVLDVGNIATTGYIRSDRDQDDFVEEGVHEITLECTTADSVLDNLPMNDLELRTDGNVNAWWKYADWLYMGAGIHHLLRWHTNMLKITDVIGLTDNQVKVFTLRWNMGTVRQSINEQSNRRGIFAQLTADEAGRLHLAEDIQMFNESKRDALPTLFTITEDDIGGDVTLTRQPEKKLFRAMLGGTQVLDNGDVVGFLSIIPGYIDGIPQRILDFSGSGSLELVNMVVETQLDSDEKVGRVFANENRVIRDLRLTFRGNYLGSMTVIPKTGWYGWNIPNVQLARNLTLPTRWICRSLSIQANHSGDVLTSVVLEPEAEGPNGIIARFPSDHPTPVADPPAWQAPAGPKAVMTWSSVHFRFYPPDPDWELINTADYLHGTLDLWWKQVNQSVHPQDAVWWGVGTAGAVEFHPSLRGTPTGLTPVADLNQWGTSILMTSVDFVQVLTDDWLSERKYLLGESEEGANWRGWLFVSDNFGDVWQVIDLYLSGDQPTALNPIWMSVSQTHLYITIWRDDELRVLKYDKTTFVHTEISLGAATFAQFSQRELWAFPVRVLDADAAGLPYYIGGRLVGTPLAGTNHILKFDGIWTSIQATWGAEHCAALKVGPDDGGGNRKIVAYQQEGLTEPIGAGGGGIL